MTIRPIKKEDNATMARVLREVLIEMGVPKVGTAYADKALDMLYETYDEPRAEYFVIEENGKLLGGAGIAQLANYDGPVCELQKMYALAEIRGKGYGKQLMQICLDFAKKQGFERVYIETMPNMEGAQNLYKKSGFYYIDGPMGNTGHCACPVHMLKDLKEEHDG
ncbi:GNAT family N-acetyltransferase [Flavimarina sp. Hel_I_48]|uniref:GNAT family N-acetyltransferase n=1 Tax=Flavimarina sp. Hel_I_48 TaxID=1392488 RepID=UPI0004DFCB72|nr:GNAT family N-acetyltransferase [Flavimarina sp. Hel_I_48]